MKGKKAIISGKAILSIGGAIVVLVGVLLLMFGFLNNNTKFVEVGAVMFLVGGGVLAMAKKFG